MTPLLVVRLAGTAIGIVVLFFVLRIIFQQMGIPSLHADVLRQGLQSKQALIARIAQLEQELGAAASVVEQAMILKRENEQLKAELGRTQGSSGILARVLTTPDRTFYGTLIVDAGVDEAVQIGQVAYAFDAIAIGTVTDVRGGQSVVELFSAPERTFTGTAEGTGTAVTLIGRGAGEFEVRMPRDVHFVVGEFITLQSVHTAVLAKIERIVTDPRDPFQRLLAKAPVNLQSLKFVVIR